MSNICEECGKAIKSDFEQETEAKGNHNKYYHLKCYDKILDSEFIDN